MQRKLPILIIDKKGVIGTALAEKLQEQFLIVLVSGKELEVHRNIIHIPYRKKIPLIPDNTYSHMFVIYNGEKEMLDILPALVKKANQTDCKLLFITHLENSTEALTRRLAHHLYRTIQVVFYGEPFADKVLEGNGVSHFIQQVRTRGRIEVPNSGLGKLYPILFDEILAVIIVTAFSPTLATKPLLIFPKHNISELSVGRMLQKINPLLKLDFKKQKSFAMDYYIPPEGQYFFENYNLEERLRKLDLTPAFLENHNHKPHRKITLPTRRRKTNFSLIFGVLAFCFLLLPFITTILLAGVGAGTLHLSFKEAEKAQFTSAKQYASYANSSFMGAKNILGSLILLDIIANQQKQDAMQQMHIGVELSEATIDTMDAALLLQNIYNDKSTDPRSDFLHATATFKNTLLVVQKLQAEKQLPQDVMEKVTAIKDMVGLLENTVDSFPVLLGFEGKRTYLVLFQNNMELRPSGGFIGSYGLLTVENGEMTDFQIYDVYDADGKLTDHIEPPYPLRRYLGAAHWYLRDSNFSADFPTSAAQASTFLELETGDKVDGVIAIDTDFLRNMLGVFGSITLHDYNETVTPENFYLLTQTHAEKDFFPGSTQKKDFLRSLANAILLRLTEQKDIPYHKLLKEIDKSIKEKHLLFAFPDSATQQLFTVNNLSSALWDGRKTEGNTFLDFIGVIDANVGANKSNYYLNKSIQQDVIIGENGDIRTTVNVTYMNSSKKDSPFGGDYKNYVRFIVPPRAVLQSVSIDKQTQPTTPAVTDPADFTQGGFIPPRELEVDEVQQDAKTSIGFFVIVPTGSTKTVSITYSIPSAIVMDDPSFIYDLKMFKQPGTKQDPFSLFVAYPSTFNLVASDKGIVDVGGKLSYSTELSRDKNIRAEFSKR